MEFPVTAIVGPIANSAYAIWGVFGLIIVVAVGAVLWLHRATSGFRAEQESALARKERDLERKEGEIARVQQRVHDLATQRAELEQALTQCREDGFKWRESYLSTKFPDSHHRDRSAEVSEEGQP